MTAREDYAKALDKVLKETHSTLFLRSYDIINNKEVCINDLLDRVIYPMLYQLSELPTANDNETEQYRTIVNDNGRFYLK